MKTLYYSGGSRKKYTNPLPCIRRIFGIILLICIFPIKIYAQIEIIALLPNPLGDDTLGEYIEIRNTGCTKVDISSYTLSDLSGKTYRIPVGTILQSLENKKFHYSETKIALNNTGNESVFLKDPYGNIIDSESYSGTQKDDIVLSIPYRDADCTSYNVSTGVTLSGSDVSSGNEVYSGSIGDDSIVSGSGDISENQELPSIGTSSGTSESSSGVYQEIATGELLDTESITTDTPSTLSLSGSHSIESLWTNSGGVSEESYSGELSQSGESKEPLVPISMYYYDSDTNNKVDTLEIVYPHILTGVVHIEQIFLFSRTGGLSSQKIDTSTGYILSGSLSGNILILRIREGDLEKTTLSINNSTSSDLRIKSSGDMGFRSLGSKVPEPFFLTKSFHEYKKVYKKSLVSETSLYVSQGEKSVSGSTKPFSFPVIIPTLQSPTNATLSGEIFICTTYECRINLTLEPIFSSGFSLRDYECYFGTGESVLLDTDCNPNTLYLSHSGSIVIELREKTNTGNISRKIFPVEWHISRPDTSSRNKDQKLSIVDTGKPVAIIELDGKWKEYYFQDGEYALICYAFTCSINLTGEKSYDPEGSKISYLWIYGQNEISTSKDPGSRKYGLGNHSIIFRVIDSAGNYSQIDYRIHVVGPKPKEEKEKVKKAKSEKKTEKSSVHKEKKPKKKKIKKMKMTFYSRANLVLQGKKGEKKSENLYICRYKRKKICSINFKLTDTQKGYEYIWEVDNQRVHKGKNPKAWKLTPGSHNVKILTYKKGSDYVFDEQSFVIQVIPEPKKPKKSKKKRKSQSKQDITLNPIQEVSAGVGDTQSSSANPGVILIFGSGVLLGYILKRRR